MVQKLYALVSNEILPDNMDSLVNQELLLPGHLYLMILKEKLEELLLGIRIRLYKDSKKTSEAIKTSEMNFIKKAVETQTTIGII
jgi:DNA-directed RNA polymerase I subunit RPA2